MPDLKQDVVKLYEDLLGLLDDYRQVIAEERSPPDYCYYDGLIDGLIAVKVRLRALLEKEDIGRR